jgi:hypothetical protein
MKCGLWGDRSGSGVAIEVATCIHRMAAFLRKVPRLVGWKGSEIQNRVRAKGDREAPMMIMRGHQGHQSVRLWLPHPNKRTDH